MHIVKSDEFSLLKNIPPPKELPIALAHALAVTKLGDDKRHETLFRIFMSLPLAGRLACNAELRECRAARRGERLAVVS